MPWFAKALLKGVLSTTPGNFFALYTRNGLLKVEARQGAVSVGSVGLRADGPPAGSAICFSTADVMLKKFIFNLNQPSVLTLKSCNTNQIPDLSFSSFSLNALAHKLPIRFRVYRDVVDGG